MADTTDLATGLTFPEGPRWRDGWLWFSDMHEPAVMRVNLSGLLEVVVEVPGRPSGLGWLPDGRLLIVSMTDRRLVTLEADGSLAEYADLSSVATSDCNDMVVDERGRAYVGNFGSELADLVNAPAPAALALVDAERRVRAVAKDLLFPNGSVITPDGRTLIVGESFGARLTAFDIAPDGSLDNRRVWAEAGGLLPDGCCLDAEGGIWVASPSDAREVLRVVEGGDITHRLRSDRTPSACMLGGDDRRTLFVCTAGSPDPVQAVARREGAIETVRVDVPGAGLP